MKERDFSTVIGWVAAIGSLIAGVYLLQSESASAEGTVFDIFFRGLGGYILCRGLWMIHSLTRRGQVQ